jgi:hypothetical protein
MACHDISSHAMNASRPDAILKDVEDPTDGSSAWDRGEAVLVASDARTQWSLPLRQP